MTLSEPRRKNCKLKQCQELPLIAAGRHRFKGVFNGLGVVVDAPEDMQNLISMGYFGKATLSRNYPQFQKRQPEVIRNRVFQNRKRNSLPSGKSQKVVVVPDSDSDADIDDYFTNLKPEYQIDKSGIKESVSLGLEETFFLASAVQCFDVLHEGQLLSLEATWRLFKQTDKHFVVNYIAYYHFRAKNWVVKPGIKFGGDFLLYKQGPPFYHASYVVVIHVVDEELNKIEALSRRSMKMSCVAGLQRLCETAGKELLICEVIWPSGLQLEDVGFNDLQKFTVKETVMKRWQVSLKRPPD